MRDLKATTAQLLANTLYQKCNEGASLNINFEPPKRGYLVAVIPGPVYDQNPNVSSIEVASFFKENWYDLADGEVYAGVWKDWKNGKIYFDISSNIMDKDVALTIAREYKQIAIWDIRNNKEIRV